MKTNYALELQKQYVPYLLYDEKENIVGFVDNAPMTARKAAKEHILLSKKYDDVSNYEHWDKLILTLGLKNIKV